MRRPSLDTEIFRERRARVAQMTPGAAVIVMAHPEYLRNGDVHHAYRQDSNLFYLTGFEEPESLLVIRAGQNPESVLFVRDKDEFNETWFGFRYGPQAAQSEFQIDQTFSFSEIPVKLPELLKPVKEVYHQWGLNKDFDRILLTMLGDLADGSRSGQGQAPVRDLTSVLAPLRQKKSKWEIECLREAARISAAAHCEAMRFTRPGVNENQVLGILLGTAHLEGSVREGYNSIVASGNNATTLHYAYNDQMCHAGDLLLIDSGFEKDHYTADITRTFPVSGKFSEVQRRVYESVLRVQENLIQMVKPGVIFKTLQEAAIDQLTQALIDLKILVGSKDENLKSLAYRTYYMHGVSHWLGLDVHDAGIYKVEGESVALEEGMVFTLEPGLYFPAKDSSLPQEYLGIGIRIEDNVVVTADGCEVLTSGVPKDVAGIEALMNEPSFWMQNRSRTA